MNQDILDNGDTGTGFYQSDQERGDQAKAVQQPSTTTPTSKKKFAEDDEFSKIEKLGTSGRHRTLNSKHE